MKINLKLNHVYMMVGPSCCGKSYLSKKIKEHCIKKYKKDYVKIISSDEWRRFTLRQDFHKHDPRMLAASSAAFSYLEHDLITSLKYPQSLYNKIIIVDTTGLNKEFRTKIDFIAKNHQYGVGVILFNFDNKEDYYTYLTEKEDKNVISFQIKKFKKSSGDLTLSRNKQDVIKINKRERNIISLLGIESHLKSELDSSLNYEIVSDIHCRLDLLKKVLIKKYKNLEIDFRFNVYARNLHKNFFICNDNLTIYRQVEDGIMSNIIKFSKKWWIKRLEAHNFMEKLFNNHNIQYKNKLDFLLSKIFGK